ncbi:hypothetical protein SEVIR_7G297400v4 [Setaria viridis]|uniref:XS domain-containing protein n=2 Tax=Setaria viridis TaxID=4556 RepID=A0A4U6U203_SETVI|nr:uncharacterized protein LOC117865930 [Setaria viridis]TKW07309.1 hypothetical protein SEVIR_7G297400v2 [Setaria viridis]
MRRGGGGGGRGGGRAARGGGGYGRRDTRPGGGASRDDRDRRPDYRPRRTPSPDRRPRRPRGEDDYRDPPRNGRIGYGGGDRSPLRRERTGYDHRRASPRRGRVEYEDPRDPPVRGPNREYGGDRHVSPRGARDYIRAPYNEDRDRYDRDGRGGDQRYETPPAYMLPDHPSDLGRPSLRAGKNERNYLGGSGDRSLLKGDHLEGGLGPRSIGNESELFGDGGVTLRISATEMGRTTAMYSQDRRSPLLRRSPPPRAALSPPIYPTVLPETGFLMGGSAMKASEDYGAGNTQLLHDDGSFKHHKHSRDPYIERSKDIERHYSGSRDLVIENGGGTERFYSAGDVTTGRVRDTDRLYSRGTLEPDLVPCTQSKFLGDSSPALLAKDHPYRMHTEPVYEPSNRYIMDGLGRSSHDSLGHGSGHRHKLSGSPLEHGSAHGDETLLDIARQSHPKRAIRAASMEYDAHDEHARRDPINDAYAAPENLRVNASLNSRHISAAPSLRGIRDERINHHLRLPHRTEEFESSFDAMNRDMEHLNKHSYDSDASIQYPTARGGNDRYSHSPESKPIGIARRPARHHESASFENLSDQEASPLVSRKRYRSPAYLYHDVYHADDGFAGCEHYDDDMDAYVLPPPRVSGYDMVDDDDEYDIPANCNVFSRLALPHENNGEWTDVDQGNHPHSDILTYGRPKHIPMSQRLSRPSSHSQFQGTFMHGRGRGRGGLTKSAKKRLKTGPHQFHGGYVSEKNEFIKPNKFSKLSEDDPNGSGVKHEDAPENDVLPVQKDPPESSDEFSKQVHQAFLNYVKILNESPAMQKKYREAAKGSLSCCVCGSVARKFPDLDALLSHAYDTSKAGLKTKHLGFHKALCVLMGWNWLVAPDTSKAHHSISSEEVNAMRGDLMLWPPVVVIHNSSIVNKAKDTEAKVVSMEEIEGVLADIGVPREKVKVSHGRPANQSVFLVKFQPTISGFQEAMRINDYFSSRNHGKEEFQQMRDGKGKKAAPVDNLEELLYAHIAVVEDLVYLDEEAKRRCKIRSKKEVEASADATLNLEP